MPNELIVAVVALVGLAAGALLLTRRRPELVFANAREETLTRKLAGEVGCELEQALPAVRRELELAPSQPDDTILKRAAYHYRREMPESACSTWGARGGG